MRIIRIRGLPSIGTVLEVRSCSEEELSGLRVPLEMFHRHGRTMDMDKIEGIGHGPRSSGEAGACLHDQCRVMRNRISALAQHRKRNM